MGKEMMLQTLPQRQGPPLAVPSGRIRVQEGASIQSVSSVDFFCGTCANFSLDNFMDYSAEGCRNSFTAGQTTRMHQTIMVYRSQPRPSLFALHYLRNNFSRNGATLYTLTGTFSRTFYLHCYQIVTTSGPCFGCNLASTWLLLLIAIFNNKGTSKQSFM